MIKRFFGALLVIIVIFVVYVFISEAVRTEHVSFLRLVLLLFFVSLLLFQAKSYFTKEKIVTAINPQPHTYSSQEQPAFEPNKRNDLITKLKSMEEPLLIPIDEFFDGNLSDIGSIGCNIYPTHPTIPVFAETFKKLLARNDVDSIYAQISEIEPDDESWPYSDKVYIYGSIEIDLIKEYTEHLQPTEIGNGRDFLSGIPKSIKLLNDKPLHVLWWD